MPHLLLLPCRYRTLLGEGAGLRPEGLATCTCGLGEGPARPPSEPCIRLEASPSGEMTGDLSPPPKDSLQQGRRGCGMAW